MISNRIIKICGITREADALGAVAQGANALGFIFAPSTRKVDVETVHDIVKRVPKDILTVGVFRNANIDEIVEVVKTAQLSAVQLHGHESVADVSRIKGYVDTVIKAVVCDTQLLTEFDESDADFLLVDGENPGSGEPHDFEPLRRVTLLTPVIAAGGLTPLTVGSVVRNYPVSGVDVSTGVESSPGLKDPVLVAQFVQAARDGFSQQLPS
jgi:phosphoribosylanthranilate isomerase